VTTVVNLNGALEGELYGPLKDPSLFERVKLDEEAGNLVWPNGADFDPGPSDGRDLLPRRRNGKSVGGNNPLRLLSRSQPDQLPHRLGW
jgi:hypothetical protein